MASDGYLSCASTGGGGEIANLAPCKEKQNNCNLNLRQNRKRTRELTHEIKKKNTGTLNNVAETSNAVDCNANCFLHKEQFLFSLLTINPPNISKSIAWHLYEASTLFVRSTTVCRGEGDVKQLRNHHGVDVHRGMWLSVGDGIGSSPLD